MKIKEYSSGIVEVKFADGEVSLFKEKNEPLTLELTKEIAEKLKNLLP